MMNYLTDDQWKPTTDLLCQNRLSISQPQPTRTTKAGKNTMLSVVVSTIHGFHPKPLGLNLNNLHKIMLMSVLTPSIVALGSSCPQYAGQVVLISVLEAKASSAKCPSGHKAPPMTHDTPL